MRKLKVEKVCPKCKEKKNIEQCFYIGKYKDGSRHISSYCKDCWKAYEKEPKRMKERSAIMERHYRKRTGKTKEERQQYLLDKQLNAAKNRCKVYFKVCLVTNKLHTLKDNKNKFFISDEGYNQYDAKTKREKLILLDNIKNNRKIIRDCVYCGKTYNVIKDKGYTPMCCSIDCSNEHERKMKRIRSKVRNDKYGQARQRAKDLGALVHRVERIKIFERDKFKCWICGKKTDKNKIGLCEDNAPTLDHVQPLTYGGSHTATNLKTACFRCNSVRQH